MEIVTEPLEERPVAGSENSARRYGRGCLLFLTAIFLTVLPVGLYWNTIWTSFGLRDDYGVVREAREEPIQIVKFCGSHARPVYGWLLEKSFKTIDHVRDLSWARLVGSVLVGVLSACTCVILVQMFSWSLLTAACVSAMLTLVPTAQVIVSWGILWPYAVAALLSMGAFVVAEMSFRLPAKSRLKQLGLYVLANAMVIVSAWTYQSCSLFYLVFVAVCAVQRGGWMKQPSRLRLIQHLLVLGGALLMAYVLIRVAFAMDLLPMSKRIAFESDFPGKLVWFAENSLSNALAVFVLHDLQGRTDPWYHIAVAATGLLLVTGGLLVGRRRGWREALVWFGAFAILTIGAYAINMVASERWSSYRTLYPLAGVVLIFAAAATEVLGEAIPFLKRGRFGLGLTVIVVAAYMARMQAYELIAVPQSKEYRLVLQESAKLDRSRDQRVYVITPTPSIAPVKLMCTDEFGSLSTDSDWVPKEIMKLHFYETKPEQPACRSLDHMVSGEKPPPPGLYDVVVDLRGLRGMTK